MLTELLLGVLCLLFVRLLRRVLQRSFVVVGAHPHAAAVARLGWIRGHSPPKPGGHRAQTAAARRAVCRSMGAPPGRNPEPGASKAFASALPRLMLGSPGGLRALPPSALSRSCPQTGAYRSTKMPAS